MSGLDPKTDKVLEIASVVTDCHLNIIAEGPELVIYQEDSVLNSMDSWNKTHHKSSGLLKLVKESTIDIAYAERTIMKFVQKYFDRNEGILAGNSIWQDRRFIVENMPQLDSYLNYRMLDVSSIKIVAQNWNKTLEPFAKKDIHRAKPDILESVEELKFYRQNVFK